MDDAETADAVLEMLISDVGHPRTFQSEHECSPWAWSLGFLAQGLLPLARLGYLRSVVKVMQGLNRYDPLLPLVRGLFDAGEARRAYDLSTFVAPGVIEGRPVPAQLLALMVVEGDAAKASLKRLAGGPKDHFGDCAEILLTGDGRVEGLGPKHVAVTALQRRASLPRFVFLARELVGALNRYGGPDWKSSAKLARKAADKLMVDLPKGDQELATPTFPAVWLDMAALYQRAGDLAARDEALDLVMEHLAKNSMGFLDAAVRRCLDLPELLTALDERTASAGKGDQNAMVLRAAATGKGKALHLLRAGRLAEALAAGVSLPRRDLDSLSLNVPLIAKFLADARALKGPRALTTLLPLLVHAQQAEDPSLTEPALAAFAAVKEVLGPPADKVMVNEYVCAYTQLLAMPGAPRAELLDALMALD